MSQPIIDRAPDDSLGQHIGKADLADRLAGIDEPGLSLNRRQARLVVDRVARILADALVAGSTVHLPGIGSVRQRAVPARAGVSPSGTAYEAPASLSISIRPAAELRRRLNAGLMDQAPAAAPQSPAEPGE